MASSPASSISQIVRFGPYEVDVRSGELRKFGLRIKLGEQPLQILLLLLERPGTLVTRSELRSRLWPDDVFVDFEHGLNSAIQRLREVLCDTAQKATWIETVPRRGYRFVGTIKQRPETPTQRDGPSLVVPSEVARVSLTEGAGTTLSAAPGLSFAARLYSWRPMVWAILAVVTLCGGILVTRRLIERTDSPLHSLAVLPLENLSTDPSGQIFADEMTDELITALAKNPDLRVVSRTSAMQYRAAQLSLPEIAQRLGVDGIVEGSASGSQGRVHINVQLIRAATDGHLWAETYDLGHGEHPSDLALTIARQVGVAASSRTQARRVDPAAQDAYLMGRYYWFAFQNEKSHEYFQRAIALDPNYAPAWSGLCDYFMVRALGDGASIGDSFRQAEAAAAKAIALDDSSVEAHNSMAAVDYFARWDWAGAERESAHAVHLNPHWAEAHHLRSFILRTLNRGEEALQEQKTATEIDPFYRPWGYGAALAQAHQFDAAIEELQQRSQAQPGDAITRIFLSQTYALSGHGKEAAAELAQAYLLMRQIDHADEIQAAYRQGAWKAVLEWQLKHLKAETESATRHVAQTEYAEVYAQLNRREDTLRALELGYAEHAKDMVHISDNPMFDSVRSEPRFQAILKKMGLPAAP